MSTRGRRIPLVVLALSPVLMTGCGMIGKMRENRWLGWVFDYAPGFTWTVSVWTIGGFLLGTVFGIVVFFVGRAVGAFRWEWKWAGILRVLAALTLMASAAIFGAIGGFNQGLYRGLHNLVESKELRRDLMPVGKVGADVVGVLYVLVARTPTEDLQAALKEMREQSPKIRDKTISAKELTELLDTPATSALEDHVWDELEQFREGAWQVDVEDLNRQAANAKAELIESILPALREKITEGLPSLEEGRDAQLVDWFIETLGPKLIDNELNVQLEKTGLRDPTALIWAGLEAAAKDSGDPDQLGHAELAGYLPIRTLEVTTIVPMKMATRGNHLGLVLVWGLGVLCMVLCFQGAELTRRQDWHGRFWRWLKRKIGRDYEMPQEPEQQSATVPLPVSDEPPSPTDF